MEPVSSMDGNSNGDSKMDASASKLDVIAIVGMGMRLPGEIHSADGLWKLLVNGESTRCKIPPNRFNASAFSSPVPNARFLQTEYGHFLAESDRVENFDTAFFQMGKAESEMLDPQQKLLLEVVYECMQNAGQVDWRGTNIGCFVGVWGDDWSDLQTKDTQVTTTFGHYRVPGGHDFGLSNRIGYVFDLKGPSFTIRSGCSSSLVALHQAVRAIQNKDCDSAIVAGTNLILSPGLYIAMSQLGVFAPDGRCKTFDAAADGYSRGEGITAIYVKRLSDSIRDCDPIRAVIRATATNCDGRTPGMTCPSTESQEALIRMAYKEAQLDPSQTCFVEAHGTGTATGDPIEVNAIARVFGNQNITYLGSVKPNLGHGEGVAGLNSILKAILTLEHRIIPPNIYFTTPNPKLPLEEANLKVPLEATPWPPIFYAERASVNSFGVGGANAHAILESAKSFSVGNSISSSKLNGIQTQKSITQNGSGGPGNALLVLSAATADSLKASISKHEKYLERNLKKLNDIVYTLCNRREHLPFRTFGVIDGSGTLNWSPIAAMPKGMLDIVMVFTGQGAQWCSMGKDLIHDYSAFRKDIQSMDAILQGFEAPPTWTIMNELLKGPAESHINDTEYAQPLVTAVQIALANLLRTWGVTPNVVVGHSSGEIAAAYAAEAISAEEAITIAYYRGQVAKDIDTAGSMVSVGLGASQVAPYLTTGVVVACENSPKNVTLSGDTDVVTAVCQKIKESIPEVFIRQLKVKIAYHSGHMQQVGDKYEQLLRPLVKSKAPVVPFFSSVQMKILNEAGQCDAPYWRANLENPVLFASAVKCLLSARPQQQIFLEVGPHSALAGPMREILHDAERKEDVYLTALTRGKNCTQSVLKAAGELFLRHIPVDFTEVSSPGRVLTDMPLYQWQHDETCWYESRVSREWRLREFPHHELIGARTLEGNDLYPEWRNLLQLEDVPWVSEHKIEGDIVFPCAGYVAMAGAAIRQISGSNDFTLRDVTVQTALVLSESKYTELMTNFRPVKLNNSLDSAWWDFTISSYNGHVWLKHCFGQARAGECMPITPLKISTYPRAIPEPYTAIKRYCGMNFGPSFKGLQNVTALPGGGTASADLSKPLHSNSPYALHPTSIDHCLQLCVVASCEGVFRRIQKKVVPTSIGHIYVNGNLDCILNEFRAQATAASDAFGTVTGNVACVVGDGMPLLMTEGTFSPLQDNFIDNSDKHAGAKIHWWPDLDLYPIEKLVRPIQRSESPCVDLEKLTVLSMLDIWAQIEHLTPVSNHIQKFHSWIGGQLGRISNNRIGSIENKDNLFALDMVARTSKLNELEHVLYQNGWEAVVEQIARVRQNCQAIIQGQIEGIDILVAENGLTRLYEKIQSNTDAASFFTLLGFSRPTLQILEIGAGTGGVTAQILKGLNSYPGQLYSTYTYTDISSGFFITAQERFKNYPCMEYKVLDISKDPLEQGFKEGFYDLIVASNVLHATPSLHATLTHVRKLLHPRGQLFLQEISTDMKWGNLIMGVLPGWWLGENDNRIQEPYVTPERWDRELKDVGFSGTDVAIFDSEPPYNINVNIISRLKRTVRSHSRITLLHRQDQFVPFVVNVLEILHDEGFQVDLCALGQALPPNQDIISLLEIESPFFDVLTEPDLVYFQKLVKGLGANGLLWVTRESQITCPDPRFGLCHGVFRSLRRDLAVSIATLEIECPDITASTAILNVYRKFQDREITDMDPDYEFVLCEGDVHIGRYHPVSVADELALNANKSDAAKVEIGVPGLLQTLNWVTDLGPPLDGDMVIIETKCVGLNLKDVLNALGILGSDTLGLEGAGIVSQVGSTVTELRVGDRVMFGYMSNRSCLATRITVPGQSCLKIPPTLSFEEAATMPAVYLTTIHSIIELAKLQKGQTVLLHAACGGVGLAAIQICRNIVGAEIFVTVGNEEKAQYLIRNFDIPRTHIFNSRDDSFLSGIMEITNGRGVDLVLNSLSGELLHTSWQCVAEFGKMLEIGARDIIGKANLRLDLFSRNRSFFGVDISTFPPDRIHRLLARMVDYFGAGLIKPITPVKSFPAAKVEEAFRYLQKGSHIGKVVVSIPDAMTELPLCKATAKLQLRSDASYLLVGGLGGLGRAISTWMIENGARHLTYLSRSAGRSQKDRAFLRELESQGCCVQTFPGSVSSLADVVNVVKGVSKPIKGVLQMAMVIRNRDFATMDYTDWVEVVQPKVQGTWNLHHILPRDLDFFVATASISGSFGYYGQANYGGANTFLDAFVTYRNSLNLPAAVLDLGAVAEVGYMKENFADQEMYHLSGGYYIHEQALLDSIHWGIRKCKREYADPDGRNHIVIGLRSKKPLADPSNRLPWKRDARVGLYYNLNTNTTASLTQSASKLEIFVSSMKMDPSILSHQESTDLIAEEIGRQIYVLMLRPVDSLDVATTLNELGMDSLVMIEMRGWIKRNLEIEISTLELLNCGTIKGVSALVLERLREANVTQ